MIRASGLQPGIALHSQLKKKVVLLELRVPREERIQQQLIYKLAINEDLVAGLSGTDTPPDFSH